jgi:hypothetical protein
MFNSITWGQYCTTVALLLVCYYLFVGFQYFRWEILNLIGIKKVEDRALTIPTVTNFKNSLVTESHEDYLPKPALEIDISPVVQSFTDEVKAYLQEADNKIQHDELLNSLQLIASKYPALKETDCRQELEQLILKEASTQYPHLLQPKDLKQLWN